MSDFGTMVSRIKRETHRNSPEDETQIKAEIISAINDYKQMRFTWNEREFTITTTDGDFTYDLPSLDINAQYIEILDLDWLKIAINDTWYPLTQYTIQLIEEHKYSDTNSKSWPAYFAIHGESFVFYPVPNGTYTIRGRCLADINEVDENSSNSDTNSWFTKGEKLIRSRAKVSFFRNYVGNPDRANAAKIEELEAFETLKIHSDRLALSGPAIPWC